VNEIEDNDLEAIAHTCQLLVHKVTQWEDEGLLTKCDQGTGLTVGRTILQREVAEMKKHIRILQKRHELVMWSVIEQGELSRGIPSVLATPSDHIFGGILPDHEQYLLTVARREIKEVLQELTHLNAVPTIYPGFLPLPLTARPLVHPLIHRII
jgi:hypothetical protein